MRRWATILLVCLPLTAAAHEDEGSPVMGRSGARIPPWLEEGMAEDLAMSPVDTVVWFAASMAVAPPWRPSW